MSVSRMGMFNEIVRSHRVATIGPNRLDRYNCLASSLWVMSPRSQVRKLAIRIMDHRYFDNIILLVIILNCVTLAMADPSLKDVSEIQKMLHISEVAFLIIFTIELLVKVTALGFLLHQGAYLRGYWNALDFVVVVSGYLQILSNGVNNLTMLRALRVCRPLRMAGRLKEVRLLMATLGSSLPLMVDVFVLLGFLVWVFAVLGLQLWSGSLHYRCYIAVGTRISRDIQQQFSPSEEQSLLGKLDPKGSTLMSPLLVLNDTEVCSDSQGHVCHQNGVTLHQECLQNKSISHFGLGTFDNIGQALLLVLKDASLDDWPQDMANFQNRSGHFAWVYWGFLSMLGNYFVFNLMLAVLSDSFSKEREKVTPKPPECMPWLRTHHSLGAIILLVLEATACYGLTAQGMSVSLLTRGYWKGDEWKENDIDKELQITVREDYVDADEEDDLEDNLVSGSGTEGESPKLTSAKLTKPPSDPGVLYTLEGRKKRLYHTLKILSAMLEGNDHTCDGGTDLIKVDIFSGQGLIVCDKKASDPYVVVEIDARGGDTTKTKFLQKLKTDPRQDTRNPVWNCPLFFKFPGLLTADKTSIPGGVPIRLTVYDKDDRSKDDFMGFCEYTFRPDTTIPTTLDTGIKIAQLENDWQNPTMQETNLGTLKFQIAMYDYEEEVRKASCGSEGEEEGTTIPIPDNNVVLPPPIMDTNKPIDDNVDSASSVNVVNERQVVFLMENDSETSPNDVNIHTKGNNTLLSRRKSSTHSRKESIHSLRSVISGVESPIVLDNLGSDPNNPTPEELEFAHVMGLKAKHIKNSVGWRRRWLFYIHNQKFQGFFFLLTIVNVAVLSADQYPEKRLLSDIIEWTNFACTIGFIIEAIIKIVIMRRDYVDDNYNIFDLVLVLISIPDLIPNGPNQKLNALRIFRMLRAIRLIKRSPSLFRVMGTIVVSLKEVVWLSLLIILFIFIYGVLGMHLFGERFEVSPGDEDWSLPHPYNKLARRDSFASFIDSCITVFVIMTGEGWGSIMWLAMAKHGWPASIYFVSAFLLGNCILLNLFVAILVDNSDRCDQVYEKHQIAEEQRAAYTLHQIAQEATLNNELLTEEQRQEIKERRGSFALMPVPQKDFGAMVEEARHLVRRKRRSSAGIIQPPSPNRRHSVNPVALFQDVNEETVTVEATNADATTSNSGTSGSGVCFDQYYGNELSTQNSPMSYGDVIAKTPNNDQSHTDEDAENARLLLGDTPIYNECIALMRQGKKVKLEYQPYGEEDSFLANKTVKEIYNAIDKSDKNLRHDAVILTKCNEQAMIAKTATDMGYGQLAQRHCIGVGSQFRKIKLSNHKDDRKPLLKVERFGPSHVSSIVADKMNSIQKLFSDDEAEAPPLEGVSLGIFSETNSIRLFLGKIVHHPQFSSLITFLIFANAVVISIQTPDVEDNHKELDRSLKTVDIVFAVIFLVECTIKIIVWGFWSTPTAYCNDKWNLIDLVVAITAFLGVFFQWMKMFRALRTIRLIVRLVEVRLMIEWLFLTIRKVLNTVALLAGFVIIWSILGVQLFKGQFAKCSDELIHSEEFCNGTFSFNTSTAFGLVSENATREWRKFNYHFDNTAEAMMLLYIMAVGDGWADFMYDGIDASGIGTGPIYNNRRWASLYFLVFVVFGQFFLMNLFVGVLIHAFVTTKEKETGACNLSDSQIHWVQAQRLLVATPLDPIIPIPSEDQEFKTLCYKIAMSEKIETAATVAILTNAILMSMTFDGEPTLITATLKADNVFFVIIFAIEAVIKIIGLTPLFYFRDTWNRFDLLIVVISIIGLGADRVNGMSVLRLFRIGRLLRLISKSSGMKTLVHTMIHSLPALWNVTLLLLVTFFMFGIAGVELFGRVNRNPYQGAGLTENVNFKNVYYALVSLYTISSTEGWVDLMRGVTVQPPNCDPDEGNCGVEKWLSSIYFTLFMIIGSSLILNLFVTVVVERYTDAEEANTHSGKLQILDNFKQKWRQCDPQATGMINAKDAVAILESLGGRLWDIRRENMLRGKTTRFIETIRTTERLCIPVGCQRISGVNRRLVRYNDVVSCLAVRIYNLDVGEEFEVFKTAAILDPSIYERLGTGYDPEVPYGIKPDNNAPQSRIPHSCSAAFDVGKLSPWQLRGPHKVYELHHMLSIDLLVQKMREHRNAKRERLLSRSLHIRNARDELKTQVVRDARDIQQKKNALLTIRCSVIQSIHNQLFANPLTKNTPASSSSITEPFSDSLQTPTTPFLVAPTFKDLR